MKNKLPMLTIFMKICDVDTDGGGGVRPEVDASRQGDGSNPL